MAEIRNCKVLVVGAGPGGYVAAIRAGQLGLDTVIQQLPRFIQLMNPHYVRHDQNLMICQRLELFFEQFRFF